MVDKGVLDCLKGIEGEILSRRKTERFNVCGGWAGRKNAKESKQDYKKYDKQYNK